MGGIFTEGWSQLTSGAWQYLDSFGDFRAVAFRRGRVVAVSAVMHHRQPKSATDLFLEIPPNVVESLMAPKETDA